MLAIDSEDKDSRVMDVHSNIKAQEAEAVDSSGRKETDPAAWLS